MKRTDSSAATITLGRGVAAELRPGDCIALCGDLGAGKTQFAKGVAAGLDSADAVGSPTFTLVREYRGGRLPVFHFDFYRLRREDEVVSLGWDEYLDAGGVLLVEWADKFPALLPANTQWWRFRVLGSGEHEIGRCGSERILNANTENSDFP